MRELQQVIRQASQPRCMVADNFQKVPVVMRIIQSARKQRLRESLDRRERSFEFMRNIRHEILANTLQAAEFRHLVTITTAPDGLSSAGLTAGPASSAFTGAAVMENFAVGRSPSQYLLAAPPPRRARRIRASRAVLRTTSIRCARCCGTHVENFRECAIRKNHSL